MLGRSHALSGLAAGAAAGLYVSHGGLAHTALLAGLTAGFATLPDLDHCGTTAARSLGLLSEVFAWIVEHISGGHRHGTHSLLGAAVVTSLAWLAWVFRATVPGKAGLALIVALAVAAGLRALHIGGHLADAAAAAGAGWLAWQGWPLSVVPLACGLGWVTHMLGDSLTDSGVMWLWPFSLRRYHLPEPFAFTTGTRPERWIVAPGLVLVTAWLGWHAAALAVR